MQRKTVTVLFCDVTGSTSFGETVDPERLRATLAEYFERMRAIVERYGGSVEKFIGDAVMAVFGVPAVHEDDALRAVRAAIEMRDALPRLGLQGRIGVMTGEVVTGTEERLVTGDPVNVAARLEQAAEPGEVLLGEATLALVRDAAQVEPTEPLDLKGKAEPVPAFRLLGVRDLPDRPPERPFVGRKRELALLREVLGRVQAERRCELFTVVGEAGVGKSRLVEEFLAAVDGTVVHGRCLPYGDGITYWPVVEVLKQLDMLPADEAAAAAIRSLLGESELETSTEEVGWAFRKTLEQAASDQPLVVVFDDIQWGEQTFRDLIEHVALLGSDASILLLCMARPELSERNPEWVVTLRLEPLGDDEVAELIADEVSDELREWIARAAGGNPLFVEEMVAMSGETGGAIGVPPTLHALLAARLDQLETAERSVLERGAIEGEMFHRGAVQALSPAETEVTPRLAALVRKRLITPDRAQLAGEDGFRFRHLLIRDVAYEALPKTTRADLHERFARWLENHGTGLVELDELAGYHLEQACKYLAELGLPEDGSLASAARQRLMAGGHRALRRQDHAAALSLFERAAALVPSTEIDLALEIELCDALFWTGRSGDALRRADDIAERASAAGDRVSELSGRVLAAVHRLYLEPEGAEEKLAGLLEVALPVMKASGDDLALYIAYLALAEQGGQRGRWDSFLEGYEQAVPHYVRHAGHLPSGALGLRAASRFFGSTPVHELLTWLDENEPPAGRDLFMRAYRAAAIAMLGRFDEARAILAETRGELAERGAGLLLGNVTTFESVWVELWAGDPHAAAEFGAEGWRLFEQLGEPNSLPDAAAELGRAHYELGQLDEAEAWADRAAEIATPGVLAAREMLWPQTKAKVLARRGEFVEAERLVRAAAMRRDESQSLNAQGEGYADLGEVLLLAGKTDEALAAFEQALDRYERKGNLVMAERVRERLAAPAV